MSKLEKFKAYISDHAKYLKEKDKLEILEDNIKKQKSLSKKYSKNINTYNAMSALSFSESVENMKGDLPEKAEALEELTDIIIDKTNTLNGFDETIVRHNDSLEEELKNNKKIKEAFSHKMNEVLSREEIHGQLTEENLLKYIENNPPEDAKLSDLDKTIHLLSTRKNSGFFDVHERASSYEYELEENTQLYDVNRTMNSFGKDISDLQMDDKYRYKTDFLSENQLNMDYLKNEIESVPLGTSFDLNPPSWLWTIGKNVGPVAIGILVFIFLSLFPVITTGIATFLAGSGIFLLRWGLPFLLGFTVLRILSKLEFIDDLIVYIISIITVVIGLYLTRNMYASDGLIQLLSTLLTIILIGLSWFESMVYLPNSFGNAVTNFLYLKLPLKNKQKNTFKQYVEQYQEAFYIASNYEMIIQDIVKLEEEVEIQDLKDQISHLNEEKEMILSSKGDEYKEYAASKYIEYSEMQEYLSDYDVIIENIREDYDEEINEVEEKRNNYLEKISAQIKSLQETLIYNMENAAVELSKLIARNETKVSSMKSELEIFKNKLYQDYRVLASELVRISESKGQISDYLFLTNAEVVDREVEPVTITELNHQKEPVVFLYDFEDYSNVSKSLDNFIRQIIGAFYMINSKESIKIIMTDPKDKARNYLQLMENNFIQIEENIRSLSETIDALGNTIGTLGASYNEINVSKYEEDGETANFLEYIVSLFIIPDSRTSNYEKDFFTESLWNLVESGSQVGYMPIFFISLRDWKEAEKEDVKAPFINNLKRKLVNKLKHVYIINNEEQTISPYK